MSALHGAPSSRIRNLEKHKALCCLFINNWNSKHIVKQRLKQKQFSKVTIGSEGHGTYLGDLIVCSLTIFVWLLLVSIYMDGGAAAFRYGYANLCALTNKLSKYVLSNVEIMSKMKTHQFK